jgi:hypothetical protein
MSAQRKWWGLWIDGELRKVAKVMGERRADLMDFRWTDFHPAQNREIAEVSVQRQEEVETLKAQLREAEAQAAVYREALEPFACTRRGTKEAHEFCAHATPDEPCVHGKAADALANPTGKAAAEVLAAARKALSAMDKLQQQIEADVPAGRTIAWGQLNAAMTLLGDAFAELDNPADSPATAQNDASEEECTGSPG